MPEKRVLIVDDSPLVLQIVRDILQSVPGVEVFSEVDGVGALARMNGSQSWDLVLLDMEMPGMGGLEVLEILRDRGRKEPIVAFTADDEPGRRSRLADLGVRETLTKPVDAATLIDLVTTGGQVWARPSEHGKPDHWPESVPWGPTLQRFNGNLDLYRKSLLRFDEEYGIWVTKPSIRGAFGTTKELRFFLHTLKGVAGYLGSREIVRAIDEWQSSPEDQGTKLRTALVRFLGEVAQFLGTSSSGPAAPAHRPQGTGDKRAYLQNLRELVYRHDSSLLDFTRPDTTPAWSDEEVVAFEELLALVHDYEFDLALPLVDHLLDGLPGEPS